MTPTRRDFFVGLAGAGAVGLIACSGSQSDLTIALDVLVTAAETAISTLSATGGISGADATLALNYLSQVSTFIDFVEMEVKTSATVLEKATAIVNEAAMLGVKQLPPGLPTIIVTVFNAVLTAINNVISSVQTTSAVLVERGINSFADQKKWNGKLSRRDRKSLEETAKKNADLKAKIAASKPRTKASWPQYPKSYAQGWNDWSGVLGS